MLLDKFVGQDETVDTLKIYTKIAKEQNRMLDHVLIYGLAGHGKTTLARIIGELMKQEVVILNAGNIKTKNDLLAVITHLNGRMLFLDELHQLSIEICEELYAILQDNKMHILLGDGVNKRSYSLDVDPFTLIGATTMPEKIPKPLLDRLGIKIKLRNYSNKELYTIIQNNLNIKVQEDVSVLIMRAGNYTPRVIINVCKRLNDLANYYRFEIIDHQNIKVLFKHLNINIFGYDQDVMEVLDTLYYDFNQDYVGEKTLINCLTINKKQYLEEIEPFMLKEQLLIKNKLGRKIAPNGINIIESN